MYPTLFSLGPITVHTYGVVMAIAFLVALWITSRQAAAAGLDRNRVVDLGVYALIAGLVGGKMALVLVAWRQFSSETQHVLWALLGLLAAGVISAWASRRAGKKAWLLAALALVVALGILGLRHEFTPRVGRELLSLVRSAGVFYGGFVVALIVTVWYARSAGLPLWRTFDVMAPGVAIGQAIGRLGCLAAGCCYGRPCSLPWAVTFRSSWSARELGTPIDEPLHPTQIYESLAVLAIFFLLVWLAPRKRFHGQLAAIYVIAYAIARFTIELWRGDARGSLLGGALSTSQALAIVAVIAAGALLPYLIRRQRVVS